MISDPVLKMQFIVCTLGHICALCSSFQGRIEELEEELEAERAMRAKVQTQSHT